MPPRARRRPRPSSSVLVMHWGSRIEDDDELIWRWLDAAYGATSSQYMNTLHEQASIKNPEVNLIKLAADVQQARF